MVTKRLLYSAKDSASLDWRMPATRSTKPGSPSDGALEETAGAVRAAKACQGAAAEAFGGAGKALVRHGATGGAGSGVVLCQGATGGDGSAGRPGMAMDLNIVVGMAACLALAAARAFIGAFAVAPLLCPSSPGPLPILLARHRETFTKFTRKNLPLAQQLDSW